MNRRHGGHGTRSLRALGGLVAAVALGAALVPVVLAPRSTPVAAAAASPGQVTEDVASLYLQNCASCHGPQGDGTPAGPTLVGVGAASVDFYLRTGRMPLGAPGQRPQRQDPAFDDSEIRALVEYVTAFGGDGPPIPQVTLGGDVHRGWELYTANCAACHAATGAGNAVGGGFVAYGLGQADPVEVAEAMLIGPGAMPRFDFGEEDRDAIVAYVEYLKTTDSPGGAPIGGFGPVAEGFVAVFVGLAALVVVARFVGRRTHAGEPESPLDTDLVDEAGGRPRTAPGAGS